MLLVRSISVYLHNQISPINRDFSCLSRKLRTGTVYLTMRNVGLHVSSLKLLIIESPARQVIWPTSNTSYCALLSKRPCLRPPARIHRRGAKSRATVTLKDLPPSVFEPDQTMLATGDDVPAYPMMIQQVRSNMEKFENCVLLTRVGNFYEAGSMFSCL